jgi:uncharacterized protein YqfA (UPF0365 family)
MTFSILAIFILLFTFIIILYFFPIGIWFTAILSGVDISLLELILMRFRKVPPALIVRSMIEANKAGIEGLDNITLQAHLLAGGNIVNVVHGLISAKKAGLTLTIKNACKADLDGVDLIKAVDKVSKSKDKLDNFIN